MKRFALLVGLAGALTGLSSVGNTAPPKPENAFLNFIKASAAGLRENDSPPVTRADWLRDRKRIRAELVKAWGGFPRSPAPLNPRNLGELVRDGYRVEKIVLQTFPGVLMTANAYVPDRKGKLPAVLCVHGHWRGAKQDPHVQARCVGLAKLGFFVLAVDAFGAGERGIGEKLGEYHGEMVAATLYPLGRPLSGLQVYENMRAVDYMLTRPEVDGERIGITGASGGGNQTMYAGAWDERFKAVVPVCSVGNYQAYLGAACCMCEVVPGALRFTEEWGVLGLTAPRALMVISATRDAFQFSVGEARKSLARTRPIYRLFDQPGNVRHAVFESTHDYNAPMREAMYGWMTRHLKGEGDGAPIKEPAMKLEDPEVLRCYPGESRPDDWLTLPQFAAREGRKQIEFGHSPGAADFWRQKAGSLRKLLDEKLLGGTTPKPSPVRVESAGEFQPEPGIRLRSQPDSAKAARHPGRVILLSLEGAGAIKVHPLAESLRQNGHRVQTFSLRATAEHAYARDQIKRAPDHNTAEWSLWLGRPLLGQWVTDVRAFLDARPTDGPTTLIGIGPAALVAVTAAAIDERVDHTVAIGLLASYLSDVPYDRQRLGLIVPGMLPALGDIPQLASLIAPRKLVVAGGVAGNGEPLTIEELREQFRFAADVFRHAGATDNLRLLPATATGADLLQP